jgi:hypothetical protein
MGAEIRTRTMLLSWTFRLLKQCSWGLFFWHKTCIRGQLVPNVLRQCSSLIFKSQMPSGCHSSLDICPRKMKPLCCLKTMGQRSQCFSSSVKNRVLHNCFPH